MSHSGRTSGRKPWRSDVVFALGGSVVAAPAAYLLVLSVAALGAIPAAEPPPDPPRLRVLVPAHNEADLLGRCLDSLQRQDYPEDRFAVTVIADNCTDDTAQIALDRAADVRVRTDPVARGKGHALRWAMDGILAEPEPPHAFVVVDADSVADPGLLSALATRVAAGDEVVQAEYLALTEDESPAAHLRAAAFLLFHRVRFTGRERLGLPCNLVGNGMLFTSDLLTRHPWDAFSGAEDLEYTVSLRLAGIRPGFAADGRLLAPVITSGAGAETQRLRWEGARLHIARTRLPGVLREIVAHGRWSLWDLAAELGTPPLGILAGAAGLGGSIGLLATALGGIDRRAVLPWLAAGGALTGHVVIGLAAAEAPPATYRALLRAPALVLSEFRTRLRLLRGTRADQWQRTARPSEISISN